MTTIILSDEKYESYKILLINQINIAIRIEYTYQLSSFSLMSEMLYLVTKGRYVFDNEEVGSEIVPWVNVNSFSVNASTKSRPCGSCRRAAARIKDDVPVCSVPRADNLMSSRCPFPVNDWSLAIEILMRPSPEL